MQVEEEILGWDVVNDYIWGSQAKLLAQYNLLVNIEFVPYYSIHTYLCVYTGMHNRRISYIT